MKDYKYVIAGAGLAGASAVSGIRQKDADGTIALFGDEKHLPYNRPPLSKDLWLGKARIEEIFVNDESFYRESKVDLLRVAVAGIDPSAKKITDASGAAYHYEKLLLATGGRPQMLPIPGGDLAGVCYYRYLDDYQLIRPQAGEGKTALVIGGGFIGSEMAAALCMNKLKVILLFPQENICQRVFPEPLAGAMTQLYVRKGVKVLSGDKPVSISEKNGRFVTRTEKNGAIESDIVIAGIGIKPETILAASARLKIDNGISVNEYLQTSDADVYAAGDNANFICKAPGKSLRVEHWDNALKQGKHAGANMAGAGEPFDYLPYFFSDLFELSYEAVGEIDPALETFADWQEENRKGVIYYLKEKKVRGVMLCSVTKKASAARKLIREAATVTPESLRGAIR